MVDFAKLREQAAARLREKHGNASTEVRFMARPKTELELLTEIKTDQDPNEWETDFCTSCIRYLAGAPDGAKLSYKQRAVLEKMVVKYNIEPDIVVDQKRMSTEVKALDDPTFDPDEDIPF